MDRTLAAPAKAGAAAEMAFIGPVLAVAEVRVGSSLDASSGA